MKKLSLYIHIPFCVKKCGYCDFLSFEYDQEVVKNYIEYLIKEIDMYGQLYKDRSIYTIFIGGGTPSLLTGEEMMGVMDAVRRSFTLCEGIEVSMESNPGTMSYEHLKLYKTAGINRISMGVQTLENETLKSLDRIHDVQMVYDSMAMIKNTGFKNMNMDLMFGLPGQTLSQLEHTLDEMIRLAPTHISAYSLKYEEGTDFYKKLSRGELVEIEDEFDRAMYHFIINKLTANGYIQYEISNFAKEGYVCQHNLVYWEKEDYLGIGLGAHGCVEHARPYNVTVLEDYYQLIDDNKLPIKGKDVIDLKDDIFETIILSLRLNKGLNLQAFEEKYHFNFIEKYQDIVEGLLKDELIRVDDTHMSLTSLGRDLSNQVFIKFLD